MKYEVDISKQAKKGIMKMPAMERARFRILIQQLETVGPILHDWPHFSGLGHNRYHCHLSYHWVAVWYWEEGTIRVEVEYAGSRENAPY